MVQTLSSLVLLAWAGIAAAGSSHAAVAPQPAAVAPGPLQGARQILLVVTDGWDAVSGTLQRFERESADAEWHAVGPAIPVVVGRAGLAWGRGVVRIDDAGPLKHEGDGKAPAGVFHLSSAFGQVRKKPAGWQMPYRYLDDNVECVDDVRSASYNRVTTRLAEQIAQTRAEWSSSEKMWQEPLYKWGVVVDHNVTPLVQPAAGSCIFLHIWNGPGRGTAGCTAMEETALTATIGWLTPKRAPLLVQLPRAEYERLKSLWRLP